MIKTIFKKKWIKWLFYAIGGFIFFSICFYASIYFGFWGKLPNKEELGSLKQAEATQVLDKDGHMIGKYYIYDRQPISYEDLPQHLIDALVATEDVRFYEHDGVDNTSLLRVFFKTILLRDKSSGGGSTITLQLAKNLYGRRKYKLFSTVINKLKESFVAKRIEDIYSKKEILTLYFNTVPFPDNTYGIESASQKFFNKSTHQLTLSEAATLVGTLKANHSYNPRLFPERSQLRRDVVLQQMVKYGYLSAHRSNQTMSQPIIMDYQYFNHDLGLAPYFREEVKKELINILEKHKKPDSSTYDIYNDGLIVHTTLDYKMQILAEEAMKEHMQVLQNDYEKSFGSAAPWKTDKDLVKNAIKNLKIYAIYKEQGLTEAQIEDSLSAKKDIELFEWSGNITKKISSLDSIQHYLKFLNTGMIAIEPTTGAVQAYLGGIDYRYFKYDHVSQSERQVGSTFKPFVYTTAIENGMKPCSYFSTKEITYTNLDNWTPKNASEQNDPYLNFTLEKALSNSVNTIAVKVLNKVGIPKVVDQVKKLGVTAILSEEPAMALGTDGIKLKELAGAYASYVNEGKSVKPYYISRIEDKNGRLIASFEPEIAETPAYNDYTRQVLLEMMKSTVEQGTATRLRTTYNLKNDIAGKTGTTQDNKDGWFVGITPNLVTITWVGNDNYNIGFKTTALGQGANTALPIFAKLYQKMNLDSTFDPITKSKFEESAKEVLKDLDCKPEKRDNFFKRLFGKKKKKKRF
ncbi:penicillin-binding protein 1A [Aquimarina sp. EL_43]|uniref:transglycosylase domain-containing protein n=1 Tax=unclassified Aquimarina TaxID=2627091 RepID=UPI0018C94430|nr:MULTISPECIES: transglycosylase domain-containing protein [unclassified Aquimarina]MBG6132457.1 penicillin-binding protein 1A [Aquimarina sp. EL_35]MBG6152588.1 penicillin-binding protein 1A [Aquimarina sp. EL_32]MBG6170485.1 penicillin-binding protein 1A [Aquimarina sp. EL_43]